MNLASPKLDMIDPMLMIRPAFESASSGASPRASLNGAETLTASVVSQIASLSSASGTTGQTPALLMRMSSRSPAAAITAAIPSSVARSTLTSTPARSTAMTSAPSARSLFAVAAPIPDAAPVTIARRPASLPVMATFPRRRFSGSSCHHWSR